MGPILSYFIILGDIIQTSIPGYNERLVKCIAILSAALLVLPFCIKKSLKEISATSFIVMGGLILFVLIILFKCFTQPGAP